MKTKILPTMAVVVMMWGAGAAPDLRWRPRNSDSVLLWGFRMTRMLLITTIAALCMVSSATAAMNRIEKSQQLKKIHRMYLQGVRDGLLAYNRQLEADTSRRGGSKPYFCLPANFDLSIDKTEKLTTRKVESAPSNLGDETSNFDERYDISFPKLLLAKLKEAYPCK